MIATVNEIKNILQIDDSNYDTLIGILRPLVQDWIFTWCNNHFEVATDTVYLVSDTISFAEGTPSEILDSESQFIDAGFVDGMSIRVQGSLYNDGVYSVEIAEAGTLTLEASEAVLDEDLEQEVTITVVKYPPALKLAYAALIGEDLKNELSKGEPVKSERVGNTSFAYGGSAQYGSYPEELLKKLRQFKRPVKA